jgi:hypothetical protein
MKPFSFLNVLTAVTALSFTLGDTIGGNSVLITGRGFSGATAADVRFGSTAATSIVVNSSTSITAVAPAHAAGSVNVSVFNSLITQSYEFWDPTVPATPTMFLDTPNAPAYNNSAGVGTWTARVGPPAVSNGASAPTESPAGTPNFRGSPIDRLQTLAYSTGGPSALVGLTATDPFTMAVVVNVAALSGDAGFIIGSADVHFALSIGNPSRVPFMWYYDSGYKQLNGTALDVGLGRAVILIQRTTPGAPVIKMTQDGVTWTAGVAVGNLVTAPTGIMDFGYCTGFFAYPFFGKELSIVTAKALWSASDVTKYFQWAAAMHP